MLYFFIYLVGDYEKKEKAYTERKAKIINSRDLLEMYENNSCSREKYFKMFKLWIYILYLIIKKMEKLKWMKLRFLN